MPKNAVQPSFQRNPSPQDKKKQRKQASILVEIKKLSLTCLSKSRNQDPKIFIHPESRNQDQEIKKARSRNQEIK